MIAKPAQAGFFFGCNSVPLAPLVRPSDDSDHVISISEERSVKLKFIHLIAAASVSMSATGETYSCKDKDGNRTYQNWPCNEKAPSPTEEARKQSSNEKERLFVICTMEEALKGIAGFKKSECKR